MSSMKCTVCNKPFEESKRNPNLINGFRCMDTHSLVHDACRAKYYEQKNKSDKRGMYSEVPVSILSIKPQLPLEI